MALLVQKFGGSSVADLDKIKLVAKKIAKSHLDGNKLVIVVSAMGHQTDRLVAMANEISSNPDPREYDVLLATGEQITISLLCMALKELGLDAKSYSGAQVPIITNGVFNKARIAKVYTENITQDIESGKVVVVAGFQGVDIDGNTTTFGRGGSDTTAVALAAALNADECQIFTDVDGVYTADPKFVNDCKKMQEITFEEMLELSSLGAKVLQLRAVELAGNYNVPLRVLSTFIENNGTLVSYEKSMEKQSVFGLAHSCDEALITIKGLNSNIGNATEILHVIAAANIEIDMISKSVVDNNKIDLSFVINRRDFYQTLHVVGPLAQTLGHEQIITDDKVAKLSLVGIGMRSHAGVTSKMCKSLNAIGVDIHLIVTSEIKVSVLFDEKYIEKGIQTLHDVFALNQENISIGLT